MKFEVLLACNTRGRVQGAELWGSEWLYQLVCSVLDISVHALGFTRAALVKSDSFQFPFGSHKKICLT